MYEGRCIFMHGFTPISLNQSLIGLTSCHWPDSARYLQANLLAAGMAIFITTRCYKLRWPRISRFKVTLEVDLKGSSAALLALEGLQKTSLELCIDQVLQRSRFAVQK